MSTQPTPFGWKPAPLADADARVTAFYQPPSGGLRTDLTATDIVKIVRSEAGRLWVDVDCHHTTWWLALAETIGFHPLTIEDTLSPESRVKTEEYEDFLFVVCRDAQFAADTPDPYDFATSNLYLFIGRSYLITVHALPSRATETLRERLATGPELMSRGVDYLAYAILDTLTDLYFPLLDQLDHFVDQLETDIFSRANPTETLERIFELKRTLLALRRHQAPMREITSALANRPTPYLQPSTQIYIRDVYDHVVRQVESIETYRDLLTGALEVHFSVLSNRTNEIMKALAIVGTFLLPATWVASIYGMNFEWMPFLHEPRGFWVAFAAMFAVSFAVLGYLKLRKWI